MGRLLSPPTAKIENLEGIVPISKGGVAAVTSLETAVAIGAVPATRRGLPNGVVPLDANAKIPLINLPAASVTTPTLKGPLEVAVGQVVSYTITNYDVKTVYTVSASAGSVSVTAGVIGFTAPATAQNVTLTINGRQVTLEVVPVRPRAPVVAAVTFGHSASTDGAGLVISASAFEMLSGSSTHKSTSWQVSLNSDFSNTVVNDQDNLVNKNTASFTGLLINTTYYVRAAFKNASDVVSGWSKPVEIKTKQVYTPNLEQARISPNDRATNDFFGSRVVLSGDGNRAFIGAYFADTSSVVNTGAVYVYVRNGLSWQFEGRLIGSDTATNNYFGFSLATNADGSRVVVGAYGNGANAGAAYVFLRSNGNWVQEAKLTPQSGATTTDSFGVSVGMSADGSRVAVGASGAMISSFAAAGAVFVFSRANTTWTQEAKLSASVVAASEFLGFTLCFSADGTRIASGATGRTVSSVPNAGAVIVFARSGTTWTQEGVLVAPTAAASSFGQGIAIDSTGTRVAVGAAGVDANGKTDVGAVFVFSRNVSAWTHEATAYTNDSLPSDGFGASLAMNFNATRIAVGAPVADVSGMVDPGAVYLFNRVGISWVQEAKMSASDKTASSNFGVSVSVNSNSSLVLVGSNAADPVGVSNAGCAYVFSS
jgi:hypothetical protein